MVDCNMQLLERERRQLAHLKDRLLRYESGRLTLSTLIAELDFLIEALEVVDAEKRSALRCQWSVLEEIYADSLDRGIRELGDESEKLVDRAVEELTRLVAEIETAYGLNLETAVAEDERDS